MSDPAGGFTFRFDGRSAVVTGGARGIGRAVAEGLAAGGAEVHVFDREAAPAAGGISFHAVDISLDVIRPLNFLTSPCVFQQREAGSFCVGERFE